MRSRPARLVSPSPPLVARLLRLLACIALAAAGTAVRAEPPAATPGRLVITDAQIAVGAAADRPADEDWQPVALPHTWARHGLPPAARTRYRVRVELPALADTTWALRIDRMGTHHELRINGHLLHGMLPAPPALLRRPVPTLLVVPTALLVAGQNEIDILIDQSVRGGLSRLEFGPIAQLEPAFAASHRHRVQWPQWLNVASIGACLVGLLIWWRRRSEAALGVFSALGALASVRNLGYFSTDAGVAAGLSDLLFYLAQVGTALMLGLFTLSVGERSADQRRRRLWWAGAIAAAAIGVVALATGHLPLARRFVYPLLLLSMLTALIQGLPAVRRLPGSSMAVLFATLGVVFVAGVHDYLYQQGYSTVMDEYWMPWAVPPAIVAFTFLLVRRVVDAMNGIEQLAHTLEDRVRERTAELEAANAAKSRFVAAASHDLRQPVATIGLLVGLIREKVDTPMLRDLAKRIDQAAMGLEALLKGLLDLSRLEAGAVQPRIRRIELQSVFDSIAAHELEAAHAYGIRLRFRPTSLSVVSDPVLLEQILRNLVGNAVACTRHGGVLVAARAHGPQVRVQVWDTGPGMTPEQQRRAFEAFVQFDTPGRRGEVRGLGLGLAIVQHSVRLLGHRLTLRSERGRGSCFTLTLPAERRGTDRDVGQPATAGFPVGRRIVLVEDDPELRDALLARLHAWSMQVQSFDGLQPLAEAIAADSLAEADLLVTDMRLPDGDGLAVIDCVRQRWPAIRSLVITGNTLPAELVRLERSGVPVLHKPFRAEALLAMLGEPVPDDRTDVATPG